MGTTLGEFPSGTGAGVVAGATSGATASDVAVKVGTTVADASVDPTTKLLVVSTGIGGTEVERVYVDKISLNVKGHLSSQRFGFEERVGGASNQMAFKVNSLTFMALDYTSGATWYHYGSKWFNAGGTVQYAGMTAGGALTLASVATQTAASLPISSSLGAGAADVAVKVGSSVVHDSVNTTAELFRVATGIGGTENGRLSVYKGAQLQGFEIGSPGVTGRLKLDNSVGWALVWGTSGIVVDGAAVTITAASGTAGLRSATNGALGTDIATKVGTMLADVSVHASATIFSVRTGIGGSEVEKLNVNKAGDLTIGGSISATNISGSSSGTNTGDQTITLTGDVTGSGTGSFAATIASSAVTLAKMANLAASTLIGRQSSGVGVPQAITLGTGLSMSAGGVLSTTDAGGTVTSVSVTTANGVSGSVATATTTPAITLTLGAITPSSVASTGTVTGTNLSGTNTGDITIGTANGLGLAGQVLSMDAASASVPGALTIGTQTIGGAKTFNSNTTVQGTLYAAGNIIGDNAGSQRIRFPGGTGTVFVQSQRVAGNSAVTIGSETPNSSFLATDPLLLVQTGIIGTPVTKMATYANGHSYFYGDTDGNAKGPLHAVATGTSTTVGAAVTLDASVLAGGQVFSFISTGPTASPGAGCWAVFQAGGGYRFLIGSQGHMAFNKSSVDTQYAYEFTSGAANAMLVNNTLAAGIGLRVRGATSQSGDLQRWESVTPTTLAKIDSAGNFTATNFSGSSSGTNTGDQTITLTGDVTGSGTGSFAATIATSAVTLAKMANLAASTLIGRNSSGAGAPVALTLGTGITISAGGVISATGTGGSVTSVSVVTANGVSGSVATETTTPAITLTLGAITPSSVQSASLFNTLGSGASDVVVKVGSSVADATVNATAKLLSIGTGIGGGSPVESLAFLKGGVMHGGTGRLELTTAGGSTLSYGSSKVWVGSGVAQVYATSYSSVSAASGAGASDVAVKVGSTVDDATVSATAKLLSIGTGIGGGSPVESVNVYKGGILGKSTTANSVTFNHATYGTALLGSTSTRGLFLDTATNASTLRGSSIYLYNEQALMSYLYLYPEVVDFVEVPAAIIGTAASKITVNATAIHATVDGGAAFIFDADAYIWSPNQGLLVSSLGDTNTDVCHIIGSDLADGSVHAAARIASFSTGIGGSEVESMAVFKGGILGKSPTTSHIVFDDTDGVKLITKDNSSGLFYNSSNQFELVGSGASFSSIGGYWQLFSQPASILSTLGAGVSDVCVTLGSQTAEASVATTAKLLSVGTGVTGTPTESLAVFKNGIIGKGPYAQRLEFDISYGTELHGATLPVKILSDLGAGSTDKCVEVGSLATQAVASHTARLFSVSTSVTSGNTQEQHNFYKNGRYESLPTPIDRHAVYTWWRTSIDATLTEAFMDGTGQRLVLSEWSALSFSLQVIAFSSNYAKRWRIEGVIHRATTVVTISTTSATTHQTSASADPWSCDVSADDTYKSLKIEVSSGENTTVNWVIKGDIVEHCTTALRSY